MDYETYTLEGFDDEGYFANVYLILMTHMKSRCLQMPPIMSRDGELQRAMEVGDKKTVSEILRNMQANASDMDPRIVAHMRYEGNAIMAQTKINHQKRNPFVPIEQGFSYIQVTPIESGNNNFGRPHILSMENRLDDLGFFSDMLVDALKVDGRFAGAKVIRGFSIGEFIDLCKSGKIDLVVFDQLDPDFGELLYVQGPRNPLYEMFHGDTQGVVSIDNNELLFNLADGRLLRPEEMSHELKKINLKGKWMSKAEVYCEKVGVRVPDYVVINTNAELQNIANIVASSLKKPEKY